MTDETRTAAIELPQQMRAQVEARLAQLDGDAIIRRIWDGDHTVWKDDPTEITQPGRLGWLTVVDAMLGEVETLQRFAAEVVGDGFTTCVLCGMGGSSLAPEVMASTFGRQPESLGLFVLDTTDPDAIAALERSLDLDRTLFCISSKSGSTIETRSHLEYFWDRTRNGRQFIAVTDPGSDLEKVATERGFRAVFRAQTDLGGRYSALSHFGLVPAALIGVDLRRLLESARAMLLACGRDSAAAENPGAVLGALMGEAALSGRDKLTLFIAGDASGLGSWIEQLIAESTGKEGKGIVPIVEEAKGASDVYGDDRLFVCIGDAEFQSMEGLGPYTRLPLRDEYELGALFVLWEFATAVAGHILAINPFDQPNVEEAKQAAGRFLSQPDGSGASAGEQRLRDLVRPGDYVALQAYVAPSPATTLALDQARIVIRNALKVATAAGYGPRFLHSTGQLHKGGPDSVVCIQIVSGDEVDLDVPGRAYSFGRLKRAQARGDLEALRARRRRVIALETGPEVAAELPKLIEKLL